MKKIMTLTIIHQGDKVLLGMKKRGFGMGRYNGFGGKVEAEESIEEAARREVFEEANLELIDLEQIGEITFSWQNKDEILEVHIFKSTQFNGIPEETEEMKPRWFETKDIPFKKMWSDDIYWMEKFLNNKKFRGEFVFDNRDQILKYEIKENDT